MNDHYKEAFLQELAKTFVLNCVRNTYLEDLHASLPGFTDDEMKKLMINVTNQTYTFFHLFLNDDKKITDNLLEYLGMPLKRPPKEWIQPALNESWVRTITQWPADKHVYDNVPLKPKA